MITSTLLLDKNDNYVYPDGSLPTRTQWDKKLLQTFIELGLVSDAGFRLLPPSLKQIATKTLGEPTCPITIQEIAALSDILIITRSRDEKVGRRFRLDAFEPILKELRLEIWKRK